MTKMLTNRPKAQLSQWEPARPAAGAAGHLMSTWGRKIDGKKQNSPDQVPCLKLQP
jgi:hypothetical protein